MRGDVDTLCCIKLLVDAAFFDAAAPPTPTLEASEPLLPLMEALAAVETLEELLAKLARLALRRDLKFDADAVEVVEPPEGVAVRGRTW